LLRLATAGVAGARRGTEDRAVVVARGSL